MSEFSIETILEIEKTNTILTDFKENETRGVWQNLKVNYVLN